jgi:hypothetical protein
MYGFEPLVKVTLNRPVLPGPIILDFLPAIFMSCGSAPLLTSLNVTTPRGTVRFERMNLNSFIVTVTVVAFCDVAFVEAAGARLSATSTVISASANQRALID